MLLMVATALALALTTASASTMLPATQPGLSADEGVFLQTDADAGGGKVNYFITQGARHAILDDDLQAELRLNPLWPYRVASRDELLAFPEGAPIGAAITGRLSERTTADDDAAPTVAHPTVADATAADEALAADPAVADQTIDDATLADAPEAEVAQPEPGPRPRPAPGLTYTVQRGDTLFSIATRLGVSLADLLAENTIPNPNRINVGQVLVIGA